MWLNYKENRTEIFQQRVKPHLLDRSCWTDEYKYTDPESY